MQNIRIVKRDYTILKEINRWRIITGKQLCQLAGFSGQRACDKRLAKLKKADLIERKKVLYGFPSLYNLTVKGKALLGIRNRKEAVRLEQIEHDITVLDTAIYFHNRLGIPYTDITTEKELHMQDGFANRKHRPDFIFIVKEKLYCVEIELTLKAKVRFEKNIVDNFKCYEKQFWIVPDLGSSIHRFLVEMETKYPNIEIIEKAEVKKQWM